MQTTNNTTPLRKPHHGSTLFGGLGLALCFSLLLAGALPPAAHAAPPATADLEQLDPQALETTCIHAADVALSMAELRDLGGSQDVYDAMAQGTPLSRLLVKEVYAL